MIVTSSITVSHKAALLGIVSMLSGIAILF